jgi:hypothetical protein
MKAGTGLQQLVLCGVLGLAGCAAAPTGPRLAEMALPQASGEHSLLVVYREHAEPLALAAKIDVDGTQILELPQKSFAYALIAPGPHTLALRWPAASGTPGWSGAAEWQSGHTYYYQLRGTAGHGFHFESSLDATDERLARATMTDCCRLITALKATATLATNQQTEPAPHRTIDFAKLKPGMVADEVIASIGAPDHVSSNETGKRFLPFYFGSDTRHVSWSYTGAGFVVFSRNEYTGVLRVVETKADTQAP